MTARTHGELTNFIWSVCDLPRHAELVAEKAPEQKKANGVSDGPVDSAPRGVRLRSIPPASATLLLEDSIVALPLNEVPVMRDAPEGGHAPGLNDQTGLAQQLIEGIPTERYRPGPREVPFTGGDFIWATEAPRAARPRNVGDIVCSPRYRAPLATPTQRKTPASREWAIFPCANAAYTLRTVPFNRIKRRQGCGFNTPCHPGKAIERCPETELHVRHLRLAPNSVTVTGWDRTRREEPAG